MSCKRMLPLVLAALLLWTVPTSAAPETTLKVAVGDPEGSEMGVVDHVFKKCMEGKTGGRAEVQYFYGDSLGDESEASRNVQKGVLPLAMGGIANLAPFEKKLGLLTLPYLSANISEAVAGTNGTSVEPLNKYATKAGFHILTWTYTDSRYIPNSKRLITKMADMQGLKFRVPQSAVLVAVYKAFGGSPAPISRTETFTTLQQGVVDGQCYGYIGFKAMRFNEANQKYLTEVYYAYQPQPLTISERIFGKITPEMQKFAVDAGKYTQDAVLKFQLKNIEAARKELITGGLVVSQLEDEDLWKKAAIKKVWSEMTDFAGGKDAISEYLRTCGEDARK